MPNTDTILVSNFWQQDGSVQVRMGWIRGLDLVFHEDTLNLAGMVIRQIAHNFQFEQMDETQLANIRNRMQRAVANMEWSSRRVDR